MLKPVVSLAALGIVGALLAKMLWLLLLPVLGMFIGFALMMLKVLLIAGLIWFGYWLFTRITERPSES